MTDRLIEDQDGAPYPFCEHCPDQVKPIDGTRDLWIHVYEQDDGRRWYLNNCERPHQGAYGEFRAKPEGLT